MVGSAHPKELPFEALIGLLEECEEDSPRHSTETHPEVLPGTLSLEEVEEDIDGRRVPKVITQDGECPHEGPAVGMQLGRGHVNLCQEGPLEACEWQVELNPFENGGVEEEEGLSVVDMIVSTYEFALCTGTNRDKCVALSPKDTPYAVRLFVLMLPYILVGGLGEEFNGGFVIYVGRRVGSVFC